MSSRIENLIVSNLFLNPTNKSWQQLKIKQNLNFLEMGNFYGLNNYVNKNTTINIIVFFQEMINDETTNKVENFEFLINLIKKLCIKTEKEVIFSFSSWQSFSNINYSQSISNEIIDLSKIIKDLRNLQKKYSNLYLINLDNFFAEKGFENCFSNRDYYLFSSKVSSFGLNLIINKISEIYLKINLPQTKVLVLDCDNTLWGGVLGEDGFDKIQIGQDGIGKIYTAFQKEILKLSKKGLLLCISSKNNNKDVINVFNNHKLMILKAKDIISFKVNWNEKYKNLIELSKELNLGLSSFIFWDDNKLEREKMKKFLPEVNTIDVEDDISLWPDQIKNHLLTSRFKTTKEDLKKIKQYRMVGKFADNKNKVNTHDDEIKFLMSIKLKPELLKIEKSLISRASQMSLKTNQFNFRTVRYSETKIKLIDKNKDSICRLVNLKDIYGDHGIIGMFILKKINKQFCFLDTMLMSCRVLGRYLDTWIFNECRKIAKLKNYKFIISEFITTEKNKTFEDSLVLNGFKKIDKKFLKINNLNLNTKNKLFVSKTIKHNMKQNIIYGI